MHGAEHKPKPLDALTDQAPPQRQISDAAQKDSSSNTGAVPGDELPAVVYRSVVLAFGWMMLAAWLAFGGSLGTDLDLAVASVLCTVFLSIPFIMRRIVSQRSQRRSQNEKRFIESSFDTATGTISGKEAWLQVALIPVALALAATLIGAVFALTG